MTYDEKLDIEIFVQRYFESKRNATYVAFFNYKDDTIRIWDAPVRNKLMEFELIVEEPTQQKVFEELNTLYILGKIQ